MLNEMLDQIQSLKIADGPGPTYTWTGPVAVRSEERRVGKEC